MEKIVLFYLVMVNVYGFVIFGYDKRCAVKRRFRVPERTLMLTALLGGSIGSYAGMQVFRHKTLHRKFCVGIPVIMLAEYGGLILLRWAI